ATPAQVMISWNLALGNVVIPKSVTPERIVSNFASLELQLTDDEIARISDLHKGEAGRRGKHPGEFAGHQGAWADGGRRTRRRPPRSRPGGDRSAQGPT